ncbi:hypothetical protein A2U01_0078017, partial [Trifolium medium]|nr:hypothetical protein [Trifolium medium]
MSGGWNPSYAGIDRGGGYKVSLSGSALVGSALSLCLSVRVGTFFQVMWSVSWWFLM